jgi:CRISPR-associated protein (Cas_APE2256)
MKVITTVGVSIFSNFNRTRSFDTAAWEDVSATDLQGVDKRKEADCELKPVINWAITDDKASAEIASLVKIQAKFKEKVEKKYDKSKEKPEVIQQYIDSESKIDVYLLCTDTALSVMAAECIKAFFKENTSFGVKMLAHIPNLTVKDKATFEIGLTNFFEKIESIIPKDKQNKLDWSSIALNITGGYKALIPHLTILGQIYRCPIYYVFEELTNQKYELMQMPKLPINYDWLVAEIYGQMLTPFGIKTFADEDDLERLVNYGLAKTTREVDTFGKFMWQYMNSRMPESPQTMGLFVEFLFYEFFNENRSEIYTHNPLRGLQLYWDGKNSEEVSDIKTDKNKETRNEFDIILRGVSNYAFVEVKSVLQIKELLKNDNLIKKIEALKSFYKQRPAEFILTIYKNPKVRLDIQEHEENLKAIKSICESDKIIFSAHWIDFEARKKDDEALDFSEFLKGKITKEKFYNNKIEI